jgi:hypothetical protein
MVQRFSQKLFKKAPYFGVLKLLKGKETKHGPRQTRNADPRARQALIDAGARSDEAAEIADRAQRFVNACESEVVAFGDLNLAANSERAQAVREAMAAGVAPSMVLSAELMERMRGKVAAEQKLESARRAAGALRSDLEAAQQHEALCKGYVADGIRSVCEFEAEMLAVEIATLEDEVLGRRARLHAIDSVWLPDSTGAGKPLSLSQSALAIMGAPSAQESIRSFNSTAQRLVAANEALWNEFARKLMVDPSATFDGEPLIERDDSALPDPALAPPLVTGIVRDLNPNPGATQRLVEAARAARFAQPQAVAAE